MTDDKTQKNYFYLDSKRIDIKESCFDLNNITLCAGLHILKFPDETPIALRVSDSIQSITYQSGWIWDKKTGKLSSVHDEWILMGLNSSGCLLHSDDTKATYFGLNYEMEKMLSRFDKMNKINNRFAKLGGQSVK